MFIFLQRFVSKYRNSCLSFKSDVLKRTLIRAIGFLIFIVFLHSFFMVLIEKFSWNDAVWLTLTTLTTTGYGDLFPKSALGRLVTELLLYFIGIFLLAKIAGDYFEFRSDVRRKKMFGLWEWNLVNHILIINTPSTNGENFFIKLVTQIRRSGLKNETIEILTEKFPTGLPEKLNELPGLTHHTGSALNPTHLIEADANKAKFIIILSKDESNKDSDSRTFDILHRLREIGVADNTLILAECVDDENRDRFKSVGADIIVRPIRAYPEMLVRGLVAPGAEQIIENLFSFDDDQYIRYNVTIIEMKWKDIVCALIINDCGIAIGYIDPETGLVDTNPDSNKCVSTKGLFVMVNDSDHQPKQNDIEKALNGKRELN